MAPLADVVNHVLGQHAWARARLAVHAGKVIRVVAGTFDWRCALTPAGLLAAAPEADGAGVVFRIDPAGLPLMLADPGAALRQVRIEGDAELAQLVGTLAREVRWDAEEDLSRLLGDVPAHHAMRAARGLAAWGQNAAGRLAGSAAAYLAEEAPVLVRPAALELHADAVADLRDACARLEKRIALLEGRRRAGAR